MLGLDAGVDTIRIDESVDLLKQHMPEPELKKLIEILEALSENPYKSDLLESLSTEFESLGVLQGAVLTYAPYIGLILDDDPFGGEDPFEGTDPFDE